MPYPLSITTKADVDELVSRRQAEQRTLEYKGQLPTGSDSDVQEFLADVSSFANAAGGYLLYGVKGARDAAGKSTGEPEEARGLKDFNADSEKLRLEALLKDSVEHRIPKLHFEPIRDFADGSVLVLSVPRSWLAPHMVKRQKSTRFYSRNSAGRYQMDLTEIREAFLQAEGIENRVRRFRDDRLRVIRASETPVPLVAGPRLVLHLVPLLSAETSMPIDLSGLHERTIELKPISATTWDRRYNLDGFVTWAGNDPSRSYLQVFRNGTLEYVDDFLLRYNPTSTSSSKPSSSTPIWGMPLCRKVLETLSRGLRSQASLGVQPPVVVMLILLGVKGMVILDENGSMPYGQSIDRDDLVLPDALIPSLDGFSPSQMRPVFDALFQSGGWPGCGGFDEHGNWRFAP